jgi:hypothetical protein
MIYRLILRKIEGDEGSLVLNNSSGSVAFIFNDEMIAMGVSAPKVPKHINPRARFYFTEHGWKVVGKKLVEIATQRGYQPKVECRKNPKASDVIWGDTYQVALLPNKRK